MEDDLTIEASIKALDEAAVDQAHVRYASLPQDCQRRVLARLSEDLEGFDPNKAFRAAILLGNTGDPRAVTFLREALSHPVPWVKRETVVSLSKLQATDLAPKVRECLAEDLRLAGDPDVSGWLAQVQQSRQKLGTLTESDLMPWFLSLIEAEVLCLGQLRDEGAIPLLSELLRHEVESLRLVAAEAIGMIGSSRGLVPLLDSLEGLELSEQVLAQVVFSMKLLGNSLVISHLRSSPKLRRGRLLELRDDVIAALEKHG